MNFEDSKLWEHLDESRDHDNRENIEKFILHMALCHSIIYDERTGKYNASSPDELALVNAAKFFGGVFQKRDEENVMIINFLGKQRKYKLLNILEFTSTRKRMSVIVKDMNGDNNDGTADLYVMTKGADSIILPRLNEELSPNTKDTMDLVENYAREGLRTLLLAQKKITLNEYIQWNQLFETAMQSVNNREEEVALVNDKMESNLELVGATAIEDKLQEGVSETIRYMREASIKVWVLTGDKIETAINIGFSSGLLDNEII